MDKVNDTSENDAGDTSEKTGSVKGVWQKPEITDFKPVTVARGISYRIGDGISNLC